ncbi:hypothetical protein B0T21DRAFT_383396 [Apiosordaria backusii]|uniref:Ubiquitin-like domain-containing protein n=1 Tax=Apiosordaria backusii TaxID=314023 RepID=A0AA40EIA3_9PEZI|nr:hypothetical protein B0T21DRAFT_383396 [Apiosordaria backusii]
MEFALTFGAVGDFLALLSLINDIRSALDDSRGSSKTYRDLIEGLTLLEKSLQQVEKIYQGPGFANGLQDLGAIAQATVNQICEVLQEFRDRICSKYGSSLASGGSGNIIRDVTRKIQWKFEEKDVEQFRAKVAGLTVSLNLLLDVTAVRLIQQNQEATAKQIDESKKTTTTTVQRYGQSIEKSVRFFGSCILSKLDFLSGLGVDLKSSASQILTLMFTMSQDLTSMGAVLLRLERGIDNGEHFVLEDATGRAFPIHLKTITSWEAFEFILNDRFKGRKGERRIRRKLYSLHESASHQEIDRSATFEDAFVPYQKVDMSIVCKAPEVPQANGAGDTGLSSCPWCHTVSPGKLGARVQCPTCKKNFTRVVIELDDDLAAPSPPTTGHTVEFSEDNYLNGDECSECHQPKRPQGDSQKQKRKRTLDGPDSDSDEEDVAGLAHIILQTKKMRIIKTEPKPKEPPVEPPRPPPPPRTATIADAQKHRIPQGYNFKQWDPTEEPIILLGSVFDANTIGKWIYDWSVHHYGAGAPLTDMAGEMWLLLIQLAGKIKRSEETIPRIRDPDNKEMVEEFIEAGDRLTDKFRKLLKVCEEPMLHTKNEGKLGKEAGVEFIKTMFGKEHELEKTEKWMVGVRLWNLRFEANCEEILRKPSALKAPTAPVAGVGVGIRS